jgi:hypothetical protein
MSRNAQEEDVGQVSWSWEADVKEGKLASFKNDVVVPWNIVAAADVDTLINRWVVDESLSAVKVYQQFTSAQAAFAQFAVNEGWGKLDNYLEPTAMYVCGDYGKDLDFLREHGAIFMLDL